MRYLVLLAACFACGCAAVSLPKTNRSGVTLSIPKTALEKSPEISKAGENVTADQKNNWAAGILSAVAAGVSTVAGTLTNGILGVVTQGFKSIEDIFVAKDTNAAHLEIGSDVQNVDFHYQRTAEGGVEANLVTNGVSTKTTTVPKP